MKTKAIIFCAALACVMSLTGCKENVANRNNATSTTVTTAVTTARTTERVAERVEDRVDEIVETHRERKDETFGIDETTIRPAVEGNTPTAVIIDGKPAGLINLNTALKKLSDTSQEKNINKLDNKKICWGLGKDTDSSGRPADAVIANEKYKEYGARFVEEADKKIYLTFDEGYENGYTSAILDILKEKGVKATFFVTYDYCETSPELVRRMINEGHTVGNHSYTHPSFPDCSVREVNEEISFLHEYVRENFDYEMSVIRFPKGEFSNRTLAIAQSLGYKSIFWSFAHVDWDVKNQPATEEAYRRITESTHPGAIVLLHAVSSANKNCLGDVIDFWHKEGYQLAVYS